MLKSCWVLSFAPETTLNSSVIAAQDKQIRMKQLSPRREATELASSIAIPYRVAPEVSKLETRNRVAVVLVTLEQI